MAESQIKNIVLDKLERVLAPNSKNNIFTEKRVLGLEADNNSCKLTLNLNGVESGSQQKLKDEIYKKLEDLYARDKIVIEVVTSAPQVSDVQSKQPAQLKVGHEKPAPKKQIQNVKNVVAIASGKGGVGKSTFAANLAIALAKEGRTVGIIDADIYGPSLPMIFGKRDEKPKANEKKKMVPLEAYGVKFISFGVFVDENDPVIWRGPMLGGVLNQFVFDVDWGELDYLLIDLPPGTGDVQLSLSQMLDLTGAIIISTPQDIALLDAKKGLNMFKKVNVDILGMVENMSYFVCDAGKKYDIFGSQGVQRKAQELNVPYLGEVPIEIELREGSDKGVPYMANSSHEGREVWKAFKQIAQKIDGQLINHKKNEGFFSKIFK